MSLNWDARKCTEAWKELDPAKQESLIFGTMAADMGEITEENHEEFFKRYTMFYMACGYPDPYLTLADVKAGIGLSTNVFTTTPAAFRKRLSKVLEDKAQEALYRAKRDQEQANAEG